MTDVSPPLQLELLETVSRAFAGHVWDRGDLARLTVAAGSGLISPAQDLLASAQRLSNFEFGDVAIPRRSLCDCKR